MSNLNFTISALQNDFYIVQNNVDFEVNNTTLELSINPMGERGLQGVQGVPGVAGLSNVVTIYNEQPAGLINGSNNTFTTASNFQPGKVSVFINGLLQKIITHYQTSGTNTILLNDSLTVGDQIQVNYIIL